MPNRGPWGYQARGWNNRNPFSSHFSLKGHKGRGGIMRTQGPRPPDQGLLEAGVTLGSTTATNYETTGQEMGMPPTFFPSFSLSAVIVTGSEPSPVIMFVFLSTQSCPTLCDPMDCSPPGSSIHEISQARILEWVAISFSGLPLYTSLNDASENLLAGESYNFSVSIVAKPSISTSPLSQSYISELLHIED